MRIARTSSRSPNEAMEVVAASAWVEVDMSLGISGYVPGNKTLEKTRHKLKKISEYFI